MAKKIEKFTTIEPEGNKPKIIREYIGRVNSGNPQVSIAHMDSSEGWTEPGQTPEFDEYTVVLNGMLLVETKDKSYKINSGQAIVIKSGEWVRYSSPEKGGAKYISVCLPAFSPDTVHRDS